MSGQILGTGMALLNTSYQLILEEGLSAASGCLKALGLVTVQGNYFCLWLLNERWLKSRRKRKGRCKLHYYDPITKEARHFVEKKDGSGTRPSTVADARKNNWYPGPSTVLKVLNKPELTNWLIRQGVMAVATAPDVIGETIDQKITRILDVECQQDEEAGIARDLGTDIHAAIELALNVHQFMDGQKFDHDLTPYVAPVVDAIMKLGRVVATEKILVGDGYAGKTDCIVENDEAVIVIDFKTSKNLPSKSPWPEAKMQTAAYTEAAPSGNKRKFCVVIYISTTEPGKIAVFENHDWQRDFERFKLLLQYWRLTNNFNYDTK